MVSYCNENKENFQRREGEKLKITPASKNKEMHRKFKTYPYKALRFFENFGATNPETLRHISDDSSPPKCRIENLNLTLY